MATLTSKITESITLDSGTVNSVNTFSVGSITQITKRIVTITTTEAEILKFGATVDAGRSIIADVRYMRFTNLDDDNFITLTFKNEDNDEVAIKLDFGQSFIWNSDNATGLVDVFNSTENANVASDTGLADLTSVQADANTGSCKLEMFIAEITA